MPCRECGAEIPEGCACSLTSSDCLTVNGDGDTTPYTVSPDLDPDAANLLTCSAAGLKATLPTLISNPPAVRVYHDAPQNILTATDTTLAFNQERFDTDTMHDNCVDEKTEILTGRGWLSYSELAMSDEVLTLNHGTGLSEWQSLIDIHVHSARPRTMIEMEGQNHSSLTTPNHRWPVIRSRYTSGGRARRGYERMFATTESLVVQDRIPIAALCADLPSYPKWDDDFVELVAWFWTEGSIMKSRGKPVNHVVVSQSPKAHLEHCERIIALLHRQFGPPVSSFGRQGSRHDGIPRWKMGASARDCIAFTLNAPIAKLLREVAPERLVKVAWLRELTSAQLELFINVSLMGDGVTTPTAESVGQKSKQMAEAFQVAVLLSGRASSLRLKPGLIIEREGSRFDGVPVPDMWHATRLSNQAIAPQSAVRNDAAFTIRSVLYDGVVWCPETPNGTWLARRNGRVFFTGNSTNNSRITMTRAGVYVVTLNVTWAANAVGDRKIRVRLNGTTLICSDERSSDQNDPFDHSTSTIYKFAAADFITAYVAQNSGSTVAIETNGNYSPEFAAVRIAVG